jgi:hypothetical protein
MSKFGYGRFSVVLALGLVTFTTGASAQGQIGNQPWGFKAQNRAGIAAMMVQKESGSLDGTSSNGSVAAATSCGGSAGNASATGNYTCIILGDGATGAITALQEALGNQSSTSDNQTTTNGVPEEELSDALEALTN